MLLINEIGLLLLKWTHRCIVALSATTKAIDSFVSADVSRVYDSLELFSFDGILLAVRRLVAKFTAVVTND